MKLTAKAKDGIVNAFISFRVVVARGLIGIPRSENREVKQAIRNHQTCQFMALCSDADSTVYKYHTKWRCTVCRVEL